MDIQQRIGADIVMQLDQCIGYPSPKEAVAASTKLSWEGPSVAAPRIPAKIRRFSPSCRAACIATCASEREAPHRN